MEYTKPRSIMLLGFLCGYHYLDRVGNLLDLIFKKIFDVQIIVHYNTCTVICTKWRNHYVSG
jgi:hypothetical protein